MLRLLYVHPSFGGQGLAWSTPSSGGMTCEVTVATTLAAARYHLASQTYDILVIQGCQVDGDGLAFVREIRAAGLGLLVVFIGAGGVSQEDALAAGADTFLPAEEAMAAHMPLLAARVYQRRWHGEAQAGERRSGAAEQRACPARVLVIDDEATVASVMQRALERAGMEVDVVHRARDGLERLRGARYDAVLCDLRLPDLSGQQFFAQLQETMPHIVRRLIFLSGDVGNDVTTDFLSRSGCRYITKPFELTQLVGVVTELLASTAEGQTKTE